MRKVLALALAVAGFAVWTGAATADQATSACGGSDTIWAVTSTSDTSLGLPSYLLAYFDKNGDSYVCVKSTNGAGTLGYSYDLKDDVQAKVVSP